MNEIRFNDRWWLAARAGLFAAFVLMPKIVAGGWAVDERMPIALVLVFVGSSNWSFRSLVVDKFSAVAIACLFVVRVAAIAITWAQYDRLYDEYREAIDRLPYGTKLTAAIAYPEGFPRSLRPPLMHLGNFITIDRDGFYQTFFANSGQQPVALTPPYRNLQDRYLDPLFFRRDQLNPAYLLSVRNPFDKDLLARYDAMLVVREHEFGLPLPDNLAPIYAGDDFRLFKIIRSPQ